MPLRDPRAAGLVGAFLAAQALSAFLFGNGASDPLTFAGVAVLMLAVATLGELHPVAACAESRSSRRVTS